MSDKKLYGAAKITHLLAEMGGGAKPKGGGMSQGIENYGELREFTGRKEGKAEGFKEGKAEGFVEGYNIGYVKSKAEDEVLRLKLRR